MVELGSITRCCSGNGTPDMRAAEIEPMVESSEFSSAFNGTNRVKKVKLAIYLVHSFM